MSESVGQQYGGGTSFLTIEEVATRYGVSQDTIRRWERSGIIPQRDSRFDSPRWSVAVLDADDKKAALKR